MLDPSITIITGEIVGNRVRILQNLLSTALLLAEVEVYGTTGAKSAKVSQDMLSEDSNNTFNFYPNPAGQILNFKFQND